MRVKKDFFKNTWSLILASFNAFNEDHALKMSAALAYYTTFSLAPLLIMLISLASFIYGGDAVQGKVFDGINQFVGNEAALQIQDIIKKVTTRENSTWAIITGFVTLFLGATGVFIEIQDSINMIWRVRAKPKKGWLKLITNRLLSFSMIATLGFLLIVSLIINGIVVVLSEHLQAYFPDITILLVDGFNIVLTFAIISALFGTIFKFLPDVEIEWKDIRVGAFFTALLFMLGRFIIGYYIETAAPGSVYGTAGSIIIILVWIYYTSAILYFGAEFTQVYAETYGGKIKPSSYAVHIIQKEEERTVKVLPPQDHEEKIS